LCRKGPASRDAVEVREEAETVNNYKGSKDRKKSATRGKGNIKEKDMPLGPWQEAVRGLVSKH